MTSNDWTTEVPRQAGLAPAAAPWTSIVTFRRGPKVGICAGTHGAAVYHLHAGLEVLLPLRSSERACSQWNREAVVSNNDLSAKVAALGHKGHPAQTSE